MIKSCSFLSKASVTPYGMRPFLLLIFLFIATVALGQRNSIQRDELLFEKGTLLLQLLDEDLNLDEISNSKGSADKKELAVEIRETILNKAYGYYKELIDSFPKSNLLFRALNNKGVIELALDDRKEAKRTFIRIINSTANDEEEGGVGSGIMGEPYANYKNRAAKALVELYVKDSNYRKALFYLDVIKKYPYRHFCGNESAADKIHMAMSYAKCYLGLKNYPAAYKILLPHIIYNGLADNSEVIEMAYKSLLINYTKSELKQRFENAVITCKIKHGDLIKGEGYSYSMIFLGATIKGYGYVPIENKIEVEKTIRKNLMESEFYRLLID